MLSLVLLPCHRFGTKSWQDHSCRADIRTLRPSSSIRPRTGRRGRPPPPSGRDTVLSTGHRSRDSPEDSGSPADHTSTLATSRKRNVGKRKTTKCWGGSGSHLCSPVPERCRSNQACSLGSEVPWCCGGSAGILPSRRHRRSGRPGRCCCCRDTAHTEHLAGPGCHSNQGCICHSLVLRESQRDLFTCHNLTLCDCSR